MYPGWTALHHAAAGGHAECVKALGEAGERALIDLRTWEVKCYNIGWRKSSAGEFGLDGNLEETFKVTEWLRLSTNASLGRDSLGACLQELAKDQKCSSRFAQAQGQHKLGHQ